MGPAPKHLGAGSQDTHACPPIQTVPSCHRRELTNTHPVRGAQHVVAGSIAGVTEHSFMFPFDTMKTIMQVRNAPAGAGGGAPAMAASEWGVLPAFAQMAEQQGMRRLWRGVQTMFTGCIPAHSAYFTIYESCKPVFGQWLARAPHDAAAAEAGGAAAAAAAAAVTVPVPPREAALAAGAAVALGTMVHDLVMTPMDVCKQRLQLGYHKNSVYDCACAIMRQEGARAFVISYPTTVVMNIPYALVMGTTNEARPAPTPTPNSDPDSNALVVGTTN